MLFFSVFSMLLFGSLFFSRIFLLAAVVCTNFFDTIRLARYLVSKFPTPRQKSMAHPLFARDP